jgi:hypothetical protein
MAIPSGTGTEVLKRFIKDGQDDTETKAIDGVANHIYTVISIIAKSRTGTNKEFYVRIAPDAGTQVSILSPDVPAAETFVMNDRFVLSGTDELVIDSEASADFDVIVSYIDQDWT